MRPNSWGTREIRGCRCCCSRPRPTRPRIFNLSSGPEMTDRPLFVSLRGLSNEVKKWKLSPPRRPDRPSIDGRETNNFCFCLRRLGLTRFTFFFFLSKSQNLVKLPNYRFALSRRYSHPLPAPGLLFRGMNECQFNRRIAMGAPVPEDKREWIIDGPPVKSTRTIAGVSDAARG